jgi:hypothetical protein
MSGQERQISYASSEDDRNIYSQAELDPSDHSTIRDAENPPAATSDKHLGVPETTPEKAQSLDDDDSNMATDLSSMLKNIKDDFVERLAHAADTALSLESQHDEDSDDAKLSYLEERLSKETGRKSIYKNRNKELTEKIGSLLEKNESLMKVNNALSSKVDTMAAEKKAAKAKAMEIFE